MSVHALQIVSNGGELSLNLACRAVPGADCRMRPPIDDDRESWAAGDPGLVDGPCWALEWVEAVGIEDALRYAGGISGLLLSADVDVSYDEGVLVTLAVPHSLLPDPTVTEDARAARKVVEAVLNDPLTQTAGNAVRSAQIIMALDGFLAYCKVPAAACDAPLSSCSPTAACCDDCTHGANWPSTEADS